MMLQGELISRHDATPAELQALGAAIQAWFMGFQRQRAEAGDDVDAWLDEDAVGDLLLGELPQPPAMRCLRVMHGMTVRELIGRLNGARERHSLTRRLLPPPQSRSVGFGFSVGEEARDDLLVSLRGRLPLDLLSEIRIDGERYGPRGTHKSAGEVRRVSGQRGLLAVPGQRDEVRGNAVIIGPITCKRCGGNGVCPGCRGSGWVAYCTVQTEDER